jgi:site-specific DNA recombinase
VRGHGHVVAEFFDEGESRTVAWGRGPQAAALVAQLADLCRGWEAGSTSGRSTPASTR